MLPYNNIACSDYNSSSQDCVGLPCSYINDVVMIRTSTFDTLLPAVLLLHWFLCLVWCTKCIVHNTHTQLWNSDLFPIIAVVSETKQGEKTNNDSRSSHGGELQTPNARCRAVLHAANLPTYPPPYSIMIYYQVYVPLLLFFEGCD